MILAGAGIIDGTGRPPARGTVRIEGGRIISVASDRGAGPGTLDLSGYTLLPGLIDAHSHLGVVDLSDRGGATSSIAVLAARIFENCSLSIDAGFTTCRDAGGIDGGVVRAIGQGLVRGPRILPSGALLCQTAGHGDLDPPFLHHRTPGVPGLVQLAQICDGPEEVRRAARENFRRGATQIKVCVSGGVVTSSDAENVHHPQFSVDELRAAVEEAEARDTYVLAHAHSVRGIRNGLAAGVRSFEHATYLDDDTAALIAAAGGYVVPTLTVAHLMADDWRAWGVPESAVERIRGFEEAMGQALRRAVAAGAKVGSGSDLLGRRQNRRGLELTLRSRLVGPLEAIRQATSANAELLRREHELGVIAPGMLADLVAVEGDPLEEPEIFDDPDRVALVITGGHIAKDLTGRRQLVPTG